MVEHLQQRQRLEEQHVPLEAAEVDAAADIEGGDVSNDRQTDTAYQFVILNVSKNS